MTLASRLCSPGLSAAPPREVTLGSPSPLPSASSWLLGFPDRLFPGKCPVGRTRTESSARPVRKETVHAQRERVTPAPASPGGVARYAVVTGPQGSGQMGAGAEGPQAGRHGGRASQRGGGCGPHTSTLAPSLQELGLGSRGLQSRSLQQGTLRFLHIKKKRNPHQLSLVSCIRYPKHSTTLYITLISK